MVIVEIDIPNKLLIAFQEAVSYYNTEHETSYTPKHVLRRLLRNFTKDTIRSYRIKIAQNLVDEEIQDLWKK